MLRSPPPSAVGKSEDTFTTLGCFGNVGFKEMQATPVVQADLFMTLSYYDKVDGDNVHLIKDDNCNDAIPEDTRVLLVKKDACLRLQTLTVSAMGRVEGRPAGAEAPYLQGLFVARGENCPTDGSE